MLLGGIAALYPVALQQKYRKIAQILGLGMIFCSYWLISEATPWPGFMALIPVIGAYLILVAHDDNLLLNHPITQSIGRWSYSIYVWHWPLVVFGLYFAIENWWMYGIPLSILIGYCSYHWIEQRKFPTFTTWKQFLQAKPLYMFMAVCLCGYTIKKTDGMLFHYSDEIQTAIAEIKNINPYDCDQKYFTECKIGNTQNIQAIIVGDSHANAVTTALTQAIDLNKAGIISVSSSACPFLIDAKFINPRNLCADVNKDRYKFLTSSQYQNVPVILTARYAAYLKGENDPERYGVEGPKPDIYFGSSKATKPEKLMIDFEKSLGHTICQTQKNHPVWVMQPTPELGFHVPKKIAKNLFFEQNKPTTISYQKYLQRNADIREAIERQSRKCGAQIIDPTEILCKSGECITQYKDRPIYRDGDHLSEYGNKLLTPMFKQIF